VETACVVSYRTAAATLNGLTGLKLSHESVWRIVQNAGDWERACGRTGGRSKGRVRSRGL